MSSVFKRLADFLTDVTGGGRGSRYCEPQRITFYHQLPGESCAAKLLFCSIYSMITIVFVTSCPEAKLANVMAVEKKLTGMMTDL